MTNPGKTLDTKLFRLAADPACRDFILADAKDADMAFGLSAPGPMRGQDAGARLYRSLAEFRDDIREIVDQRLVDIMLMSVSMSERLTIRERLFESSPVTPAVRANDTTDIWLAGGVGRYGEQPSLPFRNATIDHAMCGREECPPAERQPGADLGLYSITLNNDAALDRATLAAYHDFRLEAERKGFRHFLEVFAPNAAVGLAAEDIPRFVNDSIVRLLAGIAIPGRPIFLKIPYFGPAAMENLVSYDSSLVVGILGGSAGTTFDAFHMLREAKKYGARAALFGRKIKLAEHQLSFVRYLRSLADDEIQPQEAVRAYHADLARLKITPARPLRRISSCHPANSCEAMLRPILADFDSRISLFRPKRRWHVGSIASPTLIGFRTQIVGQCSAVRSVGETNPRLVPDLTVESQTLNIGRFARCSVPDDRKISVLQIDDCFRKQRAAEDKNIGTWYFGIHSQRAKDIPRRHFAQVVVARVTNRREGIKFRQYLPHDPLCLVRLPDETISPGSAQTRFISHPCHRAFRPAKPDIQLGEECVQTFGGSFRPSHQFHKSL